MLQRIKRWLGRDEWDAFFREGHDWTIAMIGSQRLPDIHASLLNLDQGGFRPRWMKRHTKIPLPQQAYEAGVRAALLSIARSTTAEEAQTRIMLSKFFNPTVRSERRLT